VMDFYGGEIADKLVDGVNKAGGSLDKAGSCSLSGCRAGAGKGKLSRHKKSPAPRRRHPAGLC